jgi:hypothetical protein
VGTLIFVFARISYGFSEPILAEFVAVPNSPSDVDPARSSANPAAAEPVPQSSSKRVVDEHGGPQGPEPTRYGDWERNGRCIDF